MSERNPDSGQPKQPMTLGTPPPHDSDDWYCCSRCGCSFHRDALDRYGYPIAGRLYCLVCFAAWAKIPCYRPFARARG